MLDLAKFSVITFDCYGTLIDWESGIFSALRPILSAHGLRVTDRELLQTYAELEAQAEQAEYRPYREILQSVVRGFGERLGFVPAAAEIASLPDSVRHWQPFPDTVPSLQALSRQFRLVILSNIDDDLFAFTAPRLGVSFADVITAQQAGCYKPCERMFRMAQNRIGVPVEKWLHAGQSIFHDVIPARSLGVSTVWVNRPSPRPGAGAAKAASAQPDLEVPNLAALAKLALEKSA